MYGQTKIEQISTFFSLKHISFGVFSSNLDASRNVNSSGSVSLFIENSLASHVQDFKSISSRLLSVDLYFKGNVKLRIFVVYIPPSSSFDALLRKDTIDLLIKSLIDTKQTGFYHAVCGDFNMHLDKFYPIYFDQPQVASKSIHRLFYHLLSHGYEDYTPVNLSASLGTFDEIIKLLELIMYDICTSDHNPVITYYDLSLLFASTKLARVQQLKRHTRRVFKFDSVSDAQLTKFTDLANFHCDVSPATFSSWHLNPILNPISKALFGLHLLKEKEFQESSIHAHLDDQDNNYDTDISLFIDSALSRTHRRITLDRIFIDHPTRPQLLTDPRAIDDAVVDHFQNFVPIRSSPSSSISMLPARWLDTYQPLPDVLVNIYDSLMNPPSLDEWLAMVSSMPNDKAAGPSMITYEMLKHLGLKISDLLLILIRSCLLKADIPDL
ncbi:unnamed protein product [Rhizophagus irregularis]|nr:unnamed protein product [Rhizophagus irregularis]